MTIDDMVRQQIAANHEVVDRMVERMLVLPGDHGVLVTPQPNGTVPAELTTDVPFGEIHWSRC